MHQRHRAERRGTLALIALGAVVLAFMALSLAVTTAGTARFAVALEYSAEVGYAVGTILDLGKSIFPVGLLMLMARRAFVLVAVLGVAWLGLAAFTWLATSATVGSAIAAIESNGTRKTESRTDTKAELADRDGCRASAAGAGKRCVHEAPRRRIDRRSGSRLLRGSTTFYRIS